MKLTYKVQPWAHQLEAIHRSMHCDAFAFFFDPGCGKTMTAINAMRWKWGLAGRVMKTLILCPPIVVENWRREILQHSSVPEGQIKVAAGTAWAKLCAFDGGPEHTGPVLITNYESLLLPKFFDKLRDWAPEVLVCDESHRLKSMSAKRTKRVIELAKGARYKFLLSGTPITNSLEDIFAQYLILDGGATFGAKMAGFRDDYFVDLNKDMPRHIYFPNRVPKKDAVERIGAAISRTAMRARKEECMDLPPLVKKRVDVAMGPEQRRAYQELEREFVTQLENGDIVATDMILTQALRLQQIVTGFTPTLEGGVYEFSDNPREAALSSIIESLGEAQFITWAVFRQNYEQIRRVYRKLGVTWVEIHGDTPAGNRQALIDRFQEGKAQAIIGHPRSGGIGVNMTAASYSVMFSRSFSFEDDLQAQARNHRGGSERHSKITRFDLVTPRTIDETVLSAIEGKSSVSEAVLGYLRNKR